MTETSITIGDNININMDEVKYEERPIYGVYFISCIGNYLDVIKEQLDFFTNTDLYKKSTKIICVICSYCHYNYLLQSMLYNSDYLHIMELVTTPENLYEKFAINNYKEHILNNEKYYIYYFHTKGVTHGDEEYYINIRRNLLFYLCQMDITLKLLQYVDAVGCDLSIFPKKHFSGNFWWSKSEHVNTLENVGDGYLAPEMYICSNPDNKYISLCQNNKTDKYSDTFLKTYEDIIKQITTSEIINWFDLNPHISALL
jgi:hypothetical protein